MGKDKLIETMEQFDFKAPIKVTFIFEDSDEECKGIDSSNETQKKNLNTTNSLTQSNHGCTTNNIDEPKDIDMYPVKTSGKCDIPMKSKEILNKKRNLISLDDKVSDQPERKLSKSANKQIADNSLDRYIHTRSSVIVNNQEVNNNMTGHNDYMKASFQLIANNLASIVLAHNLCLKHQHGTQGSHYYKDFLQHKLFFFYLSYGVASLILTNFKLDSDETKYILDQTVEILKNDMKIDKYSYNEIKKLYLEMIQWTLKKKEDLFKVFSSYVKIPASVAELTVTHLEKNYNNPILNTVTTLKKPNAQELLFSCTNNNKDTRSMVDCTELPNQLNPSTETNYYSDHTRPELYNLLTQTNTKPRNKPPPPYVDCNRFMKQRINLADENRINKRNIPTTTAPNNYFRCDQNQRNIPVNCNINQTMQISNPPLTSTVQNNHRSYHHPLQQRHKNPPASMPMSNLMKSFTSPRTDRCQTLPYTLANNVNDCHSMHLNHIQSQSTISNCYPVTKSETNNRNCEIPVPVFALHLSQENTYNATDISRSSISTDSGFISPIHFNVDLKQTKFEKRTENINLQPKTSHITSLTPSCIKIGLCYTCGKQTEKMCLGCYKFYYCTSKCQSEHWHEHRFECGRQLKRFIQK